MLSDVRTRNRTVHDEKISLDERISHDERIEYDEEIAHDTKVTHDERIAPDERILDGFKKGNIFMKIQLVTSV